MENLGQQYLQALVLEDEFAGKQNEASLNKLVGKHLVRFPFNNIAVLLNDSILSMSTDDLFQKIVISGEGGYCFEQNKLIFDVLKNLDFEVSAYLARVTYRNQDEDKRDVPRTHRITILTLNEDRYLVDVGFGAYTPCSIIKLDGEEHIAANGNKYRVVTEDEFNYSLELIKDELILTLYEFDLGKYTESDYAVANFYTNKFPESKFVNNLLITSIMPEKSFALNNSIFSTISFNDRENIKIQSAGELQKIIKEKFNLSISIDSSIYLYDAFCI